MLIVANKDNTYELTGNGDVIEMTSDEHGNSAMAVGSGARMRWPPRARS